MILLLGGTSEAGPIALELAKRGFRVLVSQATDVPLKLPDHPGIERRSGILDAAGLEDLIRKHDIHAIVDAAHPFAAQLHATATRLARELHIPGFSYVRPGLSEQPGEEMVMVPDHVSAARMAFSWGRPVLLTVGAKNLEPYVERSRAARVPLLVRVLDREESREACRLAGVPPEFVVTGRGPFSVEDNRLVIRHFSIGVLVTKDSGSAGGVPEKLRAAREEGCRVVVVARPLVPRGEVFSDLAALVRSVERVLRSAGT